MIYLRAVVALQVASLIAIVAGELAIEREAVGSTTWKRKKVRRGIESDLRMLARASRGSNGCESGFATNSVPG
jgi:hypothetical protein